MHVIVHIGAPKAGSSSIQGAIYRNRTALAQQGIRPYIPDFGPMSRAVASRFQPKMRHLTPNMRVRFDSVAEMRDWSARCWAELAQMVQAEQPAVTLLSSEELFSLPQPKAFIAALREIFTDITMIAYLRDPVAQYTSQLDQLIRGGARLRDLPVPGGFQYYGNARLETYHELLGPARMVVRSFDRANLAEGDVVTDFFAQLSHIAQRPVTPATMPPRGNESLCGAASAWLLSVNETFERFGSGDETAVRRRNELFKRLRADAALAALPKLRLTDPEIAALVRHEAHDRCTRYNALFLDGQPQLPTGPAPAHEPDATELRMKMRDWIFGHLTPAHLAHVLAAAVPLADADVVPPAPAPQGA